MALTGFSSAAPNLLRRSSAVINTPPFTMHCKFKTTSNTSQHMMGLFWSAAGTRFYSLRTVNLTVIAGTQGNSGGALEAATTATASSGVWASATGVWVSDSDRNVFLNGANKVQNTDTATITASANRTSIGVRDTSTPISPVDGQIAEAAIWNIALSDAEVASVHSSHPLLVRASNLLGYWPCWGSGLGSSIEADLSGKGAHLSLVGSLSIANHAPMMRPRRRPLWVPYGVAAPAATARSSVMVLT
jgi:hypothetical protein